MIKNYCLAVVNLLIVSLPILTIWEINFYLAYFAILIIIVFLLSWNFAGEMVIIKIIFNAKKMQSNADMFPILNAYLNEIFKSNLMRKNVTIFYVDSLVPYYIPISKTRVVVSLALEQKIITEGQNFLFNKISENIYNLKLIYSRRILLLSLFVYIITIRVIELWTMVFAIMVKLICAIIIVCVNGALFGSGRDFVNSFLGGIALGSLFVKINDLFNLIQDKLVNWIMKISMSISFNYTVNSGRIK